MDGEQKRRRREGGRKKKSTQEEITTKEEKGREEEREIGKTKRRGESVGGYIHFGGGREEKSEALSPPKTNSPEKSQGPPSLCRGVHAMNGTAVCSTALLFVPS